jgi:hypothetical protein
MTVRAVVLSFLCFVSLVALYKSNAFIPYNMSPSEQSSTGDLKIQLSSGSSPSVLKVTVKNESKSKTFSLLTWNTPLDEQALNIGALTLEDAKSGEAVPGLQMKVNRKMPPPRDAIVEVSPQSTASKEVNISFPWIPKDGKVYRIQVQGKWKAVWAKPASQITDDELAEMTGDSHIDGTISSESLELRLGETETS